MRKPAKTSAKRSPARRATSTRKSGSRTVASRDKTKTRAKTSAKASTKAKTKTRKAKRPKRAAAKTTNRPSSRAKASPNAAVTTAAAAAKLPYRPCAGLTVFNRYGQVFIGRRNGGPEHTDATHIWQMPQGGIDKGEDAYAGALRELYEETNIRSVKRLGAVKGWLTYDIPAHLLGKAWKGRYRGQKQKWFALLFTGDDTEINVHSPGGGQHKPEFIEWRWEPIDNLPRLVVPFKRDIYRQVVKEFRKFARRSR